MGGCRLFLCVCLLTTVAGKQDQHCSDGFYGSRCQHTCPRNCNGQLCNIDKFGRTVCINGCVDGYRASSCKIPCPVNCQVCERFNDSCTSCKDAFHGTNCTLTCEELCQGFRCDTDKTCSKTTCLDGRYGQNCSNRCYPRYLTCARSTGDCTACRDGYYGQFCELDCPPCGFTRGSMDQTCKDGCKTTPCPDTTHDDSGNIELLHVLIPVVLLLQLVTVIALILQRRLFSRRFMKKTAGDKELKKPLLKEDADSETRGLPASFQSMIEEGKSKPIMDTIASGDDGHKMITEIQRVC